MERRTPTRVLALKGTRVRAAAIPLILHQSWKTRQIPRGLVAAHGSWARLQPEWRRVLHTDADNDRLVERSYPWLSESWARLSHIQRADVARYMYMHAYGGVYADLDVRLLRPLAPLLAAAGANRSAGLVLLGQEPLEHAVLLEHQPRLVCNAVLVSTAGHPFWLELLRTVLTIEGGTDPVASTGPHALERALSAWRASARATRPRAARVEVLPPEAFYPTWDPMQATIFMERCDGRAGAHAAAQPALAAAERAVCRRLRARRFANEVPSDGTAFAEHLWSHTWIAGAEKVALADVVGVR